MTEAEQALVDFALSVSESNDPRHLFEPMIRHRNAILAERFHPMRAEFDAAFKAREQAFDALHAICEKLPGPLASAWFSAAKNHPAREVK